MIIDGVVSIIILYHTNKEARKIQFFYLFFSATHRIKALVVSELNVSTTMTVT